MPAIRRSGTGNVIAEDPAEERSTQLELLCPCGRRPVELRARGCCRLCYYRRYRSLRWFGGLRELVLERDRFRCCACGAARRLVVHHRDGRNVKPLLITLCIRCHMRLHHSLYLRRWVPEALLGLWRELHPGAPLQLQLPFVMTIAAAYGVGAKAEQGKPESPQPSLALGEKPNEQPLGCAEAFIGKDNGLGLANRVGDEALGVQPFESIPFEALPGSRPIMQGQIKERENGLIDFVRVNLDDLPASYG